MSQQATATQFVHALRGGRLRTEREGEALQVLHQVIEDAQALGIRAVLDVEEGAAVDVSRGVGYMHPHACAAAA